MLKKNLSYCANYLAATKHLQGKLNYFRGKAVHKPENVWVTRPEERWAE